MFRVQQVLLDRHECREAEGLADLKIISRGLLSAQLRPLLKGSRAWRSIVAEASRRISRPPRRNKAYKSSSAGTW
jgi:hypothetical protein